MTEPHRWDGRVALILVGLWLVLGLVLPLVVTPEPPSPEQCRFAQDIHPDAVPGCDFP